MKTRKKRYRDKSFKSTVYYFQQIIFKDSYLAINPSNVMQICYAHLIVSWILIFSILVIEKFHIFKKTEKKTNKQFVKEWTSYFLMNWNKKWMNCFMIHKVDQREERKRKRQGATTTTLWRSSWKCCVHGVGHFMGLNSHRVCPIFSQKRERLHGVKLITLSQTLSETGLVQSIWSTPFLMGQAP